MLQENKKKQYKEYFLKELFEKDLPYMKNISPTEYIVGNNDDIEAKYFFRSLDSNNTEWSINWKFTENNKNTSPEAWKQITTTSYRVLEDFVNKKHPKKIEISGNTDQKNNLYKSKSFVEKLENQFNNEYKIDNSDWSKINMISIDEVYKSNIKKRMETLNESYEQSLNYWKNCDSHTKSKIERNKILNKQIKRQVMKEAYLLEESTKITRIYLDMDGVIAGFDEKFEKSNDEGLSFKEYINKYSTSKGWDIINKAGVKYWSSMNWNPGGKELYDYVTQVADKNGIEVWILSSPGLDPYGDAKKGKNEWLDKHTNIPQSQRVFKQAKNKYTEAQPGYMLIDDIDKNVNGFIEAGGLGIKNNPKNSTEAIKKLHKFGLK